MLPVSRRLFMGGTFATLATAGIGSRGFAQGAPSLIIGTKLELNTLDPHFFHGFPQGSSHSLIFDALLTLDSELRLVPGLATAYRNVDPVTWEFDLRQNVKFHDGSDFTADDVIATLERVPKVPNSPNPFTQFTRLIVKSEKLGDHKIRFTTQMPSPTLASDLARVFIISKKHVAASTADFNNGAAGAAIGTGPYKVAEWVNGQQLVLNRNDAYWGPKQPWAKVTEKVIKGDAGRIAALLAGDVDAIDEVPTIDIPRIKQDKRFTIASGASATVQYIAMDAVRDVSPFISAKDGQPALLGNPLKDRRVRKALSLAINRQLIVDRILDGSGTPASQFLPSRFDGTSTKLKVDPYDLEKAKALLKEAGYANGFKITLHATGDRYPKDKDIAQAVGQSWTRLGLQVAVEAVPGTVFFTQATKQEYSIFMAQYGTEEASIGPRALVHTPGGIYGTANRTKFSHTDIDAAIEKAQAEMDPVKRKPLVQAAIEISMNEQAIIPVFHPNSEMASKANIAITPRPERRFNALMMKPKA
ncbi:MAG: ABC transporter substrate-binding protein [Ferrovibrio sp.]